jgi:hypothetical protein
MGRIAGRWTRLAVVLAAAWGLGVAAPAGAWRPPANAQLRVVHAQVGTPAVDVLLDGAPLVVGLGFGRDTGYLIVPSGGHTVAVVPSGMAADGAPARALELAAGHLYTAVAIAPAAAPLVLEDESLAPQGGPPLVRLVHAAPAAPPLQLEVAGAAVLAAPVAYGEASPYAEVAGGTLRLAARLADAPTALAGIPDATLAADRAYTFITLGPANGTPAPTILPLLDSTAPTVPTARESAAPNQDARPGRRQHR